MSRRDSSLSPAEQVQQRERADYRERLYRLLDDFTVFFQRHLANRPDSEVARYLATRGLDPDTIKKFRIGAAPDSWDEGMKFGLARGYTEKEMLDAGVILRNEESGRIYDRFRNRLVFAIWNEQGKVVGFSARTVEKEAGGAKYVNSPETAVFKKSRILYALPLARAAIGSAGQVILCEGQLDVIAMHRAGAGLRGGAAGHQLHRGAGSDAAPLYRPRSAGVRLRRRRAEGDPSCA